jgi:hypothetical protein
MPEKKGAERRKAPRIEVICPIAVYQGTSRVTGTIRNISPGGLGFDSPEVLEANTSYPMEFSLPQGPHLKLRGQVLWRFQQKQSYCYGVTFSLPGFITRWRLNRYLAKIIKTNRIVP